MQNNKKIKKGNSHPTKNSPNRLAPYHVTEFLKIRVFSLLNNSRTQQKKSWYQNKFYFFIFSGKLIFWNKNNNSKRMKRRRNWWWWSKRRKNNKKRVEIEFFFVEIITFLFSFNSDDKKLSLRKFLIAFQLKILFKHFFFNFKKYQAFFLFWCRSLVFCRFLRLVAFKSMQKMKIIIFIAFYAFFTFFASLHMWFAINLLGQ